MIWRNKSDQAQKKRANRVSSGVCLVALQTRSKSPSCLALTCLPHVGPNSILSGVMPCSVPSATTKSRPRSAFCNSCGAPAGCTEQVGLQQVQPCRLRQTIRIFRRPTLRFRPLTATVPPAYVAAPPVVASSAGLSENAAAAIAYLTIIPAIIFLVLEPYNKMPLVRFHSWQSIGLCVAAFVLQVIITFAEIFTHFIPGIILSVFADPPGDRTGPVSGLAVPVILKASKG